jgi:hypothetical protein
MGPAGPTSEKAAKQMKNTVILVVKRCKNWACEARDQVHQLCFFFFFFSSLRLVFFFITPWPLKQQAQSKKKKKKHNLAEKITSVLRLDF